MAETTAPAPSSATTGKGLAARILGVVFSPYDTYADVAARPRMLGALLFVLALNLAAFGVFSSSQRGREMALDQAIRTMETFNVQITDEMYAGMEDSMINGNMIFPMISQAVFWPIIMAAMAGLLFVVFNVLLGYESTFKHVFAVVVYSSVLLSLQQLFIFPMMYLKQSMASPTSLTVFMPFLDEESFAARFLGVFDLFRLWWLANLSIGIAVLYKKRMGPIFMSLLVVYVVIALVWATAGAILSGM
jgi:hypothetical protein